MFCINHYKQFVLVALLSSALIACNNTNGKSQKSTENTQVSSATTKDEVVEDYTPRMASSQAKMNELRFQDWTKRQWFDNEYVSALRDTLNRYNKQGVYQGDRDFPNISFAQNRFVVLDSEPFKGGGLFMAFAFEDHLDEIYIASVFSNCDEYEQLLADDSTMEEILESANKGIESEEFKLPTDIIVEKLAKMSNLHWWYDVRAIRKSNQVSHETASTIEEHMAEYRLSWK